MVSAGSTDQSWNWKVMMLVPRDSPWAGLVVVMRLEMEYWSDTAAAVPVKAAVAAVISRESFIALEYYLVIDVLSLRLISRIISEGFCRREVGNWV